MGKPVGLSDVEGLVCLIDVGVLVCLSDVDGLVLR